MDFEMMCETLARKIFQCGRFDDPLGRLANTDSWYGLHSDTFSEEHRCKAWAIVSRLKHEYLDSITSRQELYEKSNVIEDLILSAETNSQIIELMIQINEIVNAMNLSEFPHLNYNHSNDKL